MVSDDRDRHSIERRPRVEFGAAPHRRLSRQVQGDEPRPPVRPPPPGDALDHASALVQDAVDDLAARLGIDRADVTVVEANTVTWPDASHGCPQPGMQYLQRRVDGAFAVLEAGGRRYDYRGGVPLALCEHADP